MSRQNDGIVTRIKISKRKKTNLPGETIYTTAITNTEWPLVIF